jgi:hypothetical protein
LEDAVGFVFSTTGREEDEEELARFLAKNPSRVLCAED